MNPNSDVKEFIELLNSKGVKYLIVGGHAVGYHGHPRFTGDTDFFVDTSERNAKLVQEAIEEFGFASIKIRLEDLRKSEMVVQLGRSPNRIDILTSLTAVKFSEAWRTKHRARLCNLPVFIISKKYLIRNKKALGRPQDLADVKKISARE